MKVNWDYFSKRRNIKLVDWITYHKLKDVGEVKYAMHKAGLEPPANELIQKCFNEIEENKKVNEIQAPKVVLKPTRKRRGRPRKKSKK